MLSSPPADCSADCDAEKWQCPARADQILRLWGEHGEKTRYVDPIETGCAQAICGQEKPAVEDLAEGEKEMALILKGIAIVMVLGLLGLTGYAYLADFTPEQSLVTKPVILDAN